MGITAVSVFQRILAVILIGSLVGCAGGAANTTSSAASLSLDTVQRQLAALPCPRGVPAALWDSLTSEMLSQLQRRASAEALVALPPLDELSKVIDLNAAGDPPGSIRLRWRYRNTGDYDQNSETNISDLTPIGRHFNKTSTAADWLTAQVADGDLNTEVNISDVTPIGRCYLQTVSAYHVELNPSGAPGSEFAEFGTAAFDTGEPDPNGWLRFSATFPHAPSGYYRVVPYYNDQRGIEGDPVYFAADQPPTAVLNADTQIGPSPLTVNFDATGSSDPEDLTLLFSWDWEGDGVIDYESGSDSTVAHEYTDLGDYAPRVIVRDVAGAEDEDGVMVFCHEWEMYPVTEVSSDFELGVLDGKPAFMYFVKESLEPMDMSLNFARSRVPVPASAEDWSLMRVVGAEQDEDGTWHYINGPTDAFMLEGRPAFVYTTSIPESTEAMYLAHATSAEPESPGDWETSLISDVPLDFSTSIDAISANDTVYIVVSSAHATDVVLLYRSLASNPAGPADWEVSEICNQGANGHFGPSASVAFIGGKLCIAVNQMDEMKIDFATTSNLAPQGPEDWEYMVADTTGETLFRPDICSVGLAGVPLIVSDQDSSLHPEGIRMTLATTSTPLDSADWTGTTQLGDSYRIAHGDPYPTGSICAVFATRRYEFDPKENLAVYPPLPGLSGLTEAEWVVELVDPAVSESVAEQPGELAKDWLFQTVRVLEGSVWKLHFARCRSKAHYTLW